MKYVNNEKIEKIKLNKDNFYVAIDFDRTITARESCDSWDASGNILGKGFKEKTYLLVEKYAPIELDYNISFKEKNKAMEEWYYETFRLYYEYHLTAEKLKESINSSNLIFRTGAKEFLENMYKINVPVVILSAGIGNVIEQFLQKNSCYYDNIYIISNFILFNESGNIKEYEGKLIHTLNKTMEGKLTHQFIEKIKNREYRLLLGDFIEDKKMVPSEEWEKTISIGFLDKNIQENLEVYTKNFDIVLTGNDATFENVKALNLL